MKYTYKFVTGEAIGVEISAEIEAFLKNEDRLEYNNNHANTRRHIPLDIGKDGGADFLAIEDEELQALLSDEPDEELLRSALKLLTPNQQILLKAIYEEGMTISQYARRVGLSQPAISMQMATAIKKLKKVLERPL